MGLRKFFGHKKAAAGDQKALWPVTLRQSPKEQPTLNPEYQNRNYPAPSGAPAIAETPAAPARHTQQEFHRPYTRVLPAGSEVQPISLQCRRLRQIVPQNQSNPSSTAVALTRCGPRYKIQPTTVYKPSPTPESIPHNSSRPSPDLVDTLVLVCRASIFTLCFVVGIFVTIVCFAFWILVTFSTFLEANNTTPQVVLEEADEEIDRGSSFYLTNKPAEDSYWRALAWVYEQGLYRLQGQESVSQQDSDQVLECCQVPGPRDLARGAARKAWDIHATCPHCHG